MSNKKIIVGNAADLEGLNRMNEVSNINKKEEADQKSIQQASLNTIDQAAKKLYSVISGNSDDLVAFSFEAMRHSYVYHHSNLGAARTADTKWLYYLYYLITKIIKIDTRAESDIRNGKRFMDMFEIRSVRGDNYLRLFDAVIIDDAADIDNKNNTKSLCKYTFTKIDFPFQKLDVEVTFQKLDVDVTSLIPHEIILADTKEMIAFLLTIVLIGRVADCSTFTVELPASSRDGFLGSPLGLRSSTRARSTGFTSGRPNPTK
jgi:hypothetical protein